MIKPRPRRSCRDFPSSMASPISDGRVAPTTSAKSGSFRACRRSRSLLIASLAWRARDIGLPRGLGSVGCASIIRRRARGCGARWSEMRLSAMTTDDFAAPELPFSSFRTSTRRRPSRFRRRMLGGSKMMEMARDRWEAMHALPRFRPRYPHDEVVRWAFRNLDQSRAGELRVLDLGCGAGRHSIFLAAEGFAVSACDISETGLAHLRKATEEKRLTIAASRGSASDLSAYASETFDAVLQFRRAVSTCRW